jgi:hypothetical protein
VAAANFYDRPDCEQDQKATVRGRSEFSAIVVIASKIKKRSSVAALS